MTTHNLRVSMGHDQDGDGGEGSTSILHRLSQNCPCSLSPCINKPNHSVFKALSPLTPSIPTEKKHANEQTAGNAIHCHICGKKGKAQNKKKYDPMISTDMGSRSLS